MVSANQYATIALKADGTVWSWGYNVNGQLGNNSTADSLTPVQVLGGESGTQYLTNVVQIAAGGGYDGGNRYFALALRANGTVFAWGNNTYGQLGNGVTGNPSDANSDNFLTPVQVLGGVTGDTYLENITQIAAGPQFAMALDKSGNVYTWGRNNVGQLGNNSTENSNTPVRVSGGLAYTMYLENVVQIAAGGDWVDTGVRDFAVVLRKDGSVMTWGSNSDGQIGNSTVGSYYTTPVRPTAVMGTIDIVDTRVEGLQGIVKVAVSYTHLTLPTKA